MTLLRKFTFYTLYCVVVGLLIFIILEASASVILKNRIGNELSIFNGILKSPNNVLDIKPSYNERWKSQEFNVSVHTNSQGYRENIEFSDNQIDVAFMGDSFTFGHGVNVLDRYTNVAARLHPELMLASFSYNNGFQPEHYEYFLDKHPQLRPKALFIGLYLGNDLDSDLNETLIERDNHGKIKHLSMPYRDIYQGTIINKTSYRYDWLSKIVEATSLGKIVASKINSSYKLRRMFMQGKNTLPNTGNRLSTELGNLDQHNLRAFTSLKNIAQIVSQRNGGLHILLIPQNYLIGDTQTPHIAPENRDRIKELRSRNGLMNAILYLCETDDLNCHDMSKILTINDYFEVDAHWNVNGHKKAGKLASDIITGTIEIK